MTRAGALSLLLLLLLAACSDQKPPMQAVNEMIESPLQNTVISSADTYPPRPVTQEDLNLSESVAANLGQHPVYPWTPRSKDSMITRRINPPFWSTP
jgi:hypothetical protein